MDDGEVGGGVRARAVRGVTSWQQGILDYCPFAQRTCRNWANGLIVYQIHD
jgi:hypothetical protein